MKKQKKENPGTDAYGVSKDREPFGEDNIRRKKRSYERRFAGYTQQRSAENPKKIVRVYTGKLYRQELDKNARIRIRVLHCVLFLAAVTLVVIAAVLDTASNYSGIVVISLIVPGVFYVRLFLTLLAYIPAGQELQIYEYRDGAGALPRAARLAAASVGVPIIASIAVLALGPDSLSGMELLHFALLICSAGCVFISGLLESRIHYTEILPEPEPKPES